MFAGLARLPIRAHALFTRTSKRRSTSTRFNPSLFRSNVPRHRSFGFYHGFARTNFLLWWTNSPEFRRFTYVVGCSALCFAAYGLEQTPITRRWRFTWVPNILLEQRGEDCYQFVLQELGDTVLPDSAPEAQRLQRVSKRLLSSNVAERSGVTDSSLWTVQVVRTDEIGAFIIPARHILVTTGMLRLTVQDEGTDHNTTAKEGGDDDSLLATLLGHEIAHNVARHAAESLSHQPIQLICSMLLGSFYGVPGLSALSALELAYSRPNDRVQEAEADAIGLLMMAGACYDPKIAPNFWMRMQKVHAEEVEEFRSTHPSHANRIIGLQSWMQHAIETRKSSPCEETKRWRTGFTALQHTLKARGRSMTF